MRPGVKHHLTGVFSLLPGDRVEAAVETTLRRLKVDASAPPARLKWADFDSRGRFLRGGVSDLTDYITRLCVSPDEDPDIALMAREAEDGAAQAGRVIASADRSRFVLFLPDMESAEDGMPTPRIRGFPVDAAVFRRVHLAFQSESGLTAAERHVAFQLVAGLSPREAAAVDGVSVQTKRVQIKSAAAKLQCTGQTDLVRLMMGQLAVLLALAGRAPPGGVGAGRARSRRRSAARGRR